MVLKPIPDHLRKERVEWIDLDSKTLDGPIDIIIDRLKTHKDDGVESIKVEESYESTYFYLLKKRPETDKEYRERVRQEKLEKIRQEKWKKEQDKLSKQLKRDRKRLYLELKKEFES